MSTPRIFNEQFKKDVKAIISIRKDEIEKVASLFSQNKSINPFKSIEYVPHPLTRIIPLLMYVFSDYYKQFNALYRNLNYSGLTEEEISKFKDIINIFQKKGLSESLIILSKNQEAERFGYVVLKSIDVLPDYRFRYGEDGKRFLFPMPIYKITFANPNENPLIFQSSLAQLDDLIMTLQKVRKSISDDLDLLKDKNLTEG